MINYIDNENTLTDELNQVESFVILKNGEIEIVENKTTKFNNIKTKLFDLFAMARLMPAFGVSLHNETLLEMKKGEWLKINFSTEQTKNGLPFNSLVFKLEKTQGFNLIRLFNNKFEGRCLFLDLDEEINLLNIVT